MSNLPIPVEALEDAGIVLGRRGAGKSNALMVLFEHELDAGHRSVMIDPKGDRYGIRLNPDKSASRFDVPIFGGDHGDYPVDEDMGERLGALVAEHDLSCLIDLSLLSLQGKQRFMLGFAPVLLQRNRAPLTLFLEEVDQFANQDPRYQPPMLVHHIANFATLGRQRGIVPWVASQRPAKVNATVRSQADTFIGMKVTSPLDREAYREWFKGHGKEAAARVEEEIGRLSPGEALVWAGANEFFDRVQFPMASTYDSGRTPKHGETIDAVTLPKLSNTAIVDMLAKPEAEQIAEPNDQARFETGRVIDQQREKIAGLERQLTDTALLAADRAREIRHLREAIRGAVAALAPLANEVPAEGSGGPEVDKGQTEAPQAPRAEPVRQRQTRDPAPAGDGKPSPAALAIADLLDRINPARVTWTQAASMTGRKASGGNFNAARKWLRESGRLIEEGDVIRSAQEPKSGMTRAEAIDLWKSVLSNPAPRMIDAMLEWDEPDTKERLGADLGAAPRGGNFNNGLSQLRRNGLLYEYGSGSIKLADKLPGERDGGRG